MIVKPIGAMVGKIVRIKWRNNVGETLEEDCTAPPIDVWRKRLETPEQRQHREEALSQPEDLDE
jgi:hypothetical protein